MFALPGDFAHHVEGFLHWVKSGTELSFTVDANTLNRAGKLKVTVHNREPLSAPEWGPVSNEAYVLVPFAFTTRWSHNKDVGEFQK